ncbi:MAG: hypothetical protein E7256_10460 [Lachnospiraceae bacterium]|nr:hypothetical protein [Lachnospiraceae bacterium]
MDNSLFLVRPSKALEHEILDYKQEHFDFGDRQINGSCGLAFYDDLNQWLDLIRSIEKDELRNGVYTSTFFSKRNAMAHEVHSGAANALWLRDR